LDTLNTVWKMEIPTLSAVDAAKAGLSMKTTNITVPNRIVPKMLNSRWMTAALLAVLLAPTADKRAVTQVPIFCPRVMKTADCQFTIPFKARV